MRDQTSLPHTFTAVGHLWDPKTQTGNYDNNRAPIDMIIIHTMQGTTPGSTAHFNNPTTQAAAQYGISLDGGIIQWLSENCVAYHAGDYEINRRAIGIEHEDGYNPQTRPNAYNEPRPDALYEGSAKLVADIASFYKIPLDREHIKLHREVSKRPTSCPGTLDIDRIINRAKEILNPGVQEEQLVSHMLKPSVFANVVTKSTNWDDFCNLAGIPAVAAGQVGMGAQVYKMLESQLNEAKRVSSQPNTPSPATTPGIPVESATVVDMSTTSSTVPTSPAPTNSPKGQAKSIWQKDVLEVLRSIASSLKGRVTL